MVLFYNLEILFTMESTRDWIWWHDVNFCTDCVNFLLSHKLLKPVVEFRTNLHVLVVLVYNNAIDVYKVGIFGMV